MAAAAMAPSGGAGPSFGTQVGQTRAFTPDSYAATVSSGGARGTVTNPSQTGPAKPAAAPKPYGFQGAPTAGVKANGYVPTYARYGTLVPTTAAAVPQGARVTGYSTPAAPHLTTPADVGGMSMAGPTPGYTAGPGGYFTAATGLGPGSSASQFRNAGVHVFQLPQQGPLEGGYFDAMNNAMQQAAQGYANTEGQKFQVDVGKMLGGLNSIGALRSGAVVADTNNLMNTYAGDVSNYNAQLAEQAAQLGLSADMQNQEINQNQQQFDLKRKDANRNAIAQAVGTVLGDIPKALTTFGIGGSKPTGGNR